MCFFPSLSELLSVSRRGRLVQELRGERTRACRRTGTRLALGCAAPQLSRPAPPARGCRTPLGRPAPSPPPLPHSAGAAPVPCRTLESSRDGGGRGGAAPWTAPARPRPCGRPRSSSFSLRAGAPRRPSGTRNSSAMAALSRAGQCFRPLLLRPHPKPTLV